MLVLDSLENITNAVTCILTEAQNRLKYMIMVSICIIMIGHMHFMYGLVMYMEESYNEYIY